MVFSVLVLAVFFGGLYLTGQWSLVGDLFKDDSGADNIGSGDFRSDVLSEEISREVPIMPGAKFDNSPEIFDGHSAFFTSDEDPSVIKDYYISEMTKRGWSKDTEFNQGPMIALTFEKAGTEPRKSLSFAIGVVLGGGRGFTVNILNQ
ncbi:MAG: hypothetical protein HZA94_00525 [Candidatus Vogelbacteria bacterium]|nr:hypothetical protein [Candidatus Vogelbacteria bacterium]